MITATITTYKTAQQHNNDIDEIRDVIEFFNEDNSGDFEIDPEPWVHGTKVTLNHYAVNWTINGEIVDELYIIKVHDTSNPNDDFCTCVTYDTNSALSEIRMPNGTHIGLDDLDGIDERLRSRRRRKQEAAWAAKRK